MRIHVTEQFSALRGEWEQAYAAHDKAAEINIDQADQDRLSEAEYNALDAVLLAAASTPTEIGEKLRIMRERNVTESWTDHHPRFMAQIERDLIELQRPCVSPQMAARFTAWADARSEYIAACDQPAGVPDEELKPFDDRQSAAFLNLIAVPCTTPGDFIVKAYCDLLGRAGHATDASGFIFEPADLSENLLGEGVHDDAHWIAVARDIDDCDLGACMISLGRVDFDPAAWLAATARAGMHVALMISADGKRALYLGDFGSERAARCMRLVAGGLGPVGDARRTAVSDYIEANRLDLVTDLRVEAEAAA